jgi:hypothetical protein
MFPDLVTTGFFKTIVEKIANFLCCVLLAEVFIHSSVALSIDCKGKAVPLQAWTGPVGGPKYSSTLSWPQR